MDCFALLEGLRAEPATAHVPVLALTNTSGPVGKRADEDGIEFVLLKENDLIEERLLAAITLLFKREKRAAGDG